MAVTGGIVERFGTGAPKVTHTVAAAVTAGRLVELTAAGRRVQHAGAASLKVCGVALQDASAAEDKIAVATGGIWDLKAAGAITVGDLVMAGAAGTVSTVPAVDATNVATLGTGMTNTRATVGIALESIADTASGPIQLQKVGS